MKIQAQASTLFLGLTMLARAEESSNSGPYLAPGRLDRMMPRTAGKDCGKFKLNCAGAEAACNNACFYANCVDTSESAKRITYTDDDNERDKNRMQSGCKLANGGASSVCLEYPFSQLWEKPQKDVVPGTYQCDEWPPAVSQQKDFDPNSASPRNSLRCITNTENDSAGSKLGNFISDKGDGREERNPACAGKLNRGDSFVVDFDIDNVADKTKVPYCILNNGKANCGNDGFQFHLTQKPTDNGKISSAYDPFEGSVHPPPGRRGKGKSTGTDNRYKLTNTVFGELFQCSIELTRSKIKNDANDLRRFQWTLFNKENKKAGEGSFDLMGDTQLVPRDDNELPLPLELGTSAGPNGEITTFKYGLPAQKPIGKNPERQQDAGYFAWTSVSVGDGRGPATGQKDDDHPNKASPPFCAVEKTLDKKKKVIREDIECWFPCYDTPRAK